MNRWQAEVRTVACCHEGGRGWALLPAAGIWAGAACMPRCCSTPPLRHMLQRNAEPWAGGRWQAEVGTVAAVMKGLVLQTRLVAAAHHNCSICCHVRLDHEQVTGSGWALSPAAVR